MITPETALNIWIKPACLALELALDKPQINTPASWALLLRSMAVESQMKYRVQIKGPARSLLQVEPQTVVLVANWVDRNLPNKCVSDLFAAGGYNLTDPTGEFRLDEISRRLETNQFFATIVARLLYWSIQERLPPRYDVQAHAQYWKDHYNTKYGKGTVGHFMDSWQTHLAQFERAQGWLA